MMNVTITVRKNVNTLSRKQTQVLKAFKSAKSIDETLEAFKEMESCFDESDLGMPCWNLAHKLHKKAQPEHVIRFGKRALDILISNVSKNVPCSGVFTVDENDKCSVIHSSSFFISSVCHLLGTACVELKRYDEGLSYLNWANRNLTKLEQDDEEISCTGKCVLYALKATEFELFKAKVPRGRLGEAANHMRKVLEVKEKLLEEGCIELGKANENVYLAYFVALDVKEALPFCLKAVEIYTKHLGSDSVEVAKIRRDLGSIYNKLGDYEKELEQHQLSVSVLKKTSSKYPELLMESGRYDELIGVLKRKVSRDDVYDDSRALSFSSMAEAFVMLGKFDEARNCLRSAQTILEKKVMIPTTVAVGFVEISRLYKMMKDHETALSMIRKALAVPHLPQDLLSRSCSRLFSLIPESGKVEEEIPYMLDVAEKLKESFGPEHCEVGYAYAHIGAAYWNSSQQELAVEFMKNSKEIMDATIGPDHVNSLRTSHALSLFYAKLGRYQEAMEIQKKVVEGLKVMGPSIQEFLDEAVMHLNEVEGVAKSSTDDSLQNVDGEDLSVTISKCEILDDGKEIK